MTTYLLPTTPVSSQGHTHTHSESVSGRSFVGFQRQCTRPHAHTLTLTAPTALPPLRHVRLSVTHSLTHNNCPLTVTHSLTVTHCHSLSLTVTHSPSLTVHSLRALTVSEPLSSLRYGTVLQYSPRSRKLHQLTWNYAVL